MGSCKFLFDSSFQTKIGKISERQHLSTIIKTHYPPNARSLRQIYSARSSCFFYFLTSLFNNRRYNLSHWWILREVHHVLLSDFHANIH